MTQIKKKDTGTDNQRNFDNIAQYYDSIYNKKEYAEETERLLKYIDNNSDGKSHLLEIGSGTGNHTLFLQNDFSITSVEPSMKMVETARLKTNVNIINSTIEKATLPDQKFDIAICLFHVINYITDSEQLEKSISVISNSLKEGGKFIFDSWHTPGVYSIGPSSRTVTFEHNGVKMRRTSKPNIDIEKNIIEVKFIFEQVESSESQKIEEIHRMRPFSIPEISNLLKKHQLIPIVHQNQSSNKLTLADWDFFSVYEKRS